MSLLLLQHRTWFIVLFQVGLVCCSLVLGWMLRFDFTLRYRQLFLLAVPILILCRLATMALFGLLRGWWRYAGVRDGIGILKAVLAGSGLFWLVMRYGLRVTSFPRSIYVLEPILTVSFLVGVRLLSRALAESVRTDTRSSKRVMVIGAGCGAQMIIREISQPGSGYSVVGCLDDDRSKRGIRIHGIPVLGPVEELSRLTQEDPVEEVLIAVPSATGAQMRRLVEICDRANVKFRTVPALKDVIAGQVSISQVREVRPTDLLGREPIRIDLESVRNLIAGRTVLVTGAAGSIGSELSRQILDFDPAHLVCVDQNETGLFHLQLDLSIHRNGSQLVICVADVGDAERMRALFGEHKPQVVFHAAAYKHVPLMETNVQEAVKNNVFALLSLLDLAADADCESFILISSDKAVNPTNIMGATKRVCELIVASRPANGMRAVSVRFGNVLGSQGSVVPVLLDQLRNNRELTITHPEIRRFFMLTHEAVALVLQAFALGNHGDILVLDMGEPIRILDLAYSVIRLSGKSKDLVKIRFTGLRPGEKFEEELFYPAEEVCSTSCEKIKRIRGTPHRWVDLQRDIQELRSSLRIDGADPIRRKLKEIIPEYSSPQVRDAERPEAHHAFCALRKSAGQN